MSGELNSEAPTSSHDSTQEGISSPSNFNFSFNVHVTLDPAARKILERIAKALENVGAVVPEVPESMEEKSTLADPVDNGEFRATIVPRPDWIHIPGAITKNAKYYEDPEGKVILKYQSGTEIELTWSEIEGLSKMEEAEYKAACEKRFPKKSQKQQITGLNHMVRAFRDGLIPIKNGLIPGHAPGPEMCSIRDLFEKELAKPKTEQKSAPTVPRCDRQAVPGYKNLEYLERGDQLQIWYSGCTVKTTWKKIEEVSRKGLKDAGQLIIKIVGKNMAKNKTTGIRQFVRAFEKGAVNKSKVVEPEEELEKNFTKFRKEEDDDAAFRPMLTSYSTRPDDNCGKVGAC